VAAHGDAGDEGEEGTAEREMHQREGSRNGGKERGQVPFTKLPPPFFFFCSKLFNNWYR